MTRKAYSAIRSLVRAMAISHAKMREQRIGEDERETDPVDQYDVALFLLDITGEWARERREAGL